MTNEGYKFEVYCTQLYKDLGKLSVVHNIQYNFRRIIGKKIIAKAQVDIEYIEWNMQKMTVECKYHTRTHVNIDEVEEFRQKLKLLGRDYAVMMTNTDYSREAAKLAQKIGITLIDHDRILKMNDRVLFKSHSNSLEQMIKDTKFELYYLRPKIRTEYVLI
jgi:hypothetical protein